MLTDGIIDLYRPGVVTGARKTLYPGKVVCTFGVGTETQYETADRNPDFVCLAVDLINLPHIVMQNDGVIAINNTTQMDLQGQVHPRSGPGDDLARPPGLPRRARAPGTRVRPHPEGLLLTGPRSAA
jgi:hypothetical protein